MHKAYPHQTVRQLRAQQYAGLAHLVHRHVEAFHLAAWLLHLGGLPVLLEPQNDWQEQSLHD